jgi:hypothetical protein
VSGRIRALINDLIEVRTGGRANLVHFVRAHLALNGIDPDGFDNHSPDDPAVIKQLETMIANFTRSR